jgi:hypothetical protein
LQSPETIDTFQERRLSFHKIQPLQRRRASQCLDIDSQNSPAGIVSESPSPVNLFYSLALLNIEAHRYEGARHVPTFHFDARARSGKLLLP